MKSIVLALTFLLAINSFAGTARQLDASEQKIIKQALSNVIVFKKGAVKLEYCIQLAGAELADQVQCDYIVNRKDSSRFEGTVTFTIENEGEGIEKVSFKSLVKNND